MKGAHNMDNSRYFMIISEFVPAGSLPYRLNCLEFLGCGASAPAFFILLFGHAREEKQNDHT
jgi:hypothetical protein